jgi:ribosomal protein S18 acetylase RimI-like enzyme
LPKRNSKITASTNSDEPHGSQSEAYSKSEVVIREIKKEETGKTAQLVARLKRLNGEFDPLLKTTDSLEEEARKIVERAVSNPDSLVLVGLTGSKVVGVVKADIRDRMFYEPRKEGAIDEFYILPEYRRGSLGKDLLSKMSEMLKARGAELITAEFPSQNEIAKRFYTKLGFRSLTNVYAKAES